MRSCPRGREPDLAREVDSHLGCSRTSIGAGAWRPRGAAGRPARVGGVERGQRPPARRASFVWLERSDATWSTLMRAARERQRALRYSSWTVLALGIGAEHGGLQRRRRDPAKAPPVSQSGSHRHTRHVARWPRTGAAVGQIANADFYDWRDQASSFEAMTYFAARPAAVVAGDRADTLVSPPSRAIFSRRSACSRWPAGCSRSTTRSLPPWSSATRSHRVISVESIKPSLGLSAFSTGRSRSAASSLPGSRFQRIREIWARITPPTTENPLRQSALNFRAAAHPKSGISLEQAQSEMTTIAGPSRAAVSRHECRERRIVVTRLHDQMVGNVRQMLYVLLGAVGSFLLLACTNLATLLLARATARIREITVRAALGASRARIVRQMLAEGLVLGLAAGAAGLVLAFAGMRALVAFIPADVPRLAEIAIDRRVLLFTLVVSLMSSVLLALAPAFQSSQVRVEHGLRQSGARSSGGRERAECAKRLWSCRSRSRSCC